PTQEAYPRVRIWRHLQGIGAVSFRNSLYVLPASDTTLEDFEWLLREIRASGGDGALFETRLTASTTDESLRGLFNTAREADYRSLAEELREIGVRARKRGEATEIAQSVSRIRRRLREIEALDFFDANGRDIVHAMLRKLESSPQPSRKEKRMTAVRAPLAQRGRVWVTRAGIKVDRMASSWLIRRRIDPEARFKFVTERNYRPGENELRFDMFEGEYTHDADRCTFEVLLDLVPDRDAGLQAIAEIVHDLDIKDHKFDRPESAGVQQLLQGIMAGTPDDDERIKRSADLFDDLHRSFARSQR
ncbi:MAG: chromate resistance protein, partial [Gemmatimonadetes bacterium]|nr:chromate resistance protein [Gemmatimonadota bacterium]